MFLEQRRTRRWQWNRFEGGRRNRNVNYKCFPYTRCTLSFAFESYLANMYVYVFFFSKDDNLFLVCVQVHRVASYLYCCMDLNRFCVFLTTVLFYLKFCLLFLFFGKEQCVLKTKLVVVHLHLKININVIVFHILLFLLKLYK